MPRVGDGAAASHVRGSRTRAGLDDTGVSSLFRGASDIGTMRVVDSGLFCENTLYVHLCHQWNQGIQTWTETLSLPIKDWAIQLFRSGAIRFDIDFSLCVIVLAKAYSFPSRLFTMS